MGVSLCTAFVYRYFAITDRLHLLEEPKMIAVVVLAHLFYGTPIILSLIFYFGNYELTLGNVRKVGRNHVFIPNLINLTFLGASAYLSICAKIQLCIFWHRATSNCCKYRFCINTVVARYCVHFGWSRQCTQ
jgi:hypothetical protein